MRALVARAPIIATGRPAIAAVVVARGDEAFRIAIAVRDPRRRAPVIARVSVTVIIKTIIVPC